MDDRLFGLNFYACKYQGCLHQLDSLGKIYDVFGRSEIEDVLLKYLLQSTPLRLDVFKIYVVGIAFPQWTLMSNFWILLAPYT